MTTLPKNHTHLVCAYQRTGKKHGRLLECGSGRIDRDTNVAHVVMNRQPIGGYTGYPAFAARHETSAAGGPAGADRREGDEDEAAGN
jgi:hypothetical protein